MTPEVRAALRMIGDGFLALANANDTTPGKHSERWIDARRASEISGMSRNWIYENTHRIPGAVRKGRSLRIPEGRFRDWMAERP